MAIRAPDGANKSLIFVAKTRRDDGTDGGEEGKGYGGKREEGGGEEGGEGKLLRDGWESKALQTVFADLKTVNKGTI